MWAPADLFTPGVGIFTGLLKGVVSYFYQHLMVLAAVLILIAVLLTLVTMLGDRRSSRAR